MSWLLCINLDELWNPHLSSRVLYHRREREEALELGKGESTVPSVEGWPHVLVLTPVLSLCWLLCAACSGSGLVGSLRVCADDLAWGGGGSLQIPHSPHLCWHLISHAAWWCRGPRIDTQELLPWIQHRGVVESQPCQNVGSPGWPMSRAILFLLLQFVETELQLCFYSVSLLYCSHFYSRADQTRSPGHAILMPFHWSHASQCSGLCLAPYGLWWCQAWLWKLRVWAGPLPSSAFHLKTFSRQQCIWFRVGTVVKSIVAWRVKSPPFPVGLDPNYRHINNFFFVDWWALSSPCLFKSL